MGTKDFALFTRQTYCLLQLRVLLLSFAFGGGRGRWCLAWEAWCSAFRQCSVPVHASGKLLALEELQVLVFQLPVATDHHLLESLEVVGGHNLLEDKGVPTAHCQLLLACR